MTHREVECVEMSEKMVDWKENVRNDGRYIKFTGGMQLDLLFVSGPVACEFDAPPGSDGVPGKPVACWEWAVIESGEERALSISSKRLLRMLAEEDDEETLLGTTLRIKAIGDGFERQWMIRRVRGTPPARVADDPRTNGPFQKRAAKSPTTDDGGDSIKARMLEDMNSHSRTPLDTAL